MRAVFGKEKRAMMLFFVIQCVIAIVLFVLAAYVWGLSIGFSVLQGGVLAIIPAFLLGLWFLYRSPSSSTPLRDLYLGEFVKILLIALMFLLMLRYGDVKLLPFLAGFCGTYAAYFVAPLFMK